MLARSPGIAVATPVRSNTMIGVVRQLFDAGPEFSHGP
jgi:hypothetical protein